MKKLYVLAIVSLFVTFAFAQKITIDGDMSDWNASMQIDVPPNDVEGIGDSVDTNYDGVMDGVINPALDFKDLYITHDDNYLYVRIDINEDGTFSDLENLVDGGMQAAIELFIDTDVDTSTGLTWGWWYTSGDYWINLSVPYGWPGFEVPHKYGINKFIGTTGTDSRWEPLPNDSCQVAVNLDDNKMEVAIPRAAIGETNGELESTAILFLAEDPTQGWVNDAAPNDVGTKRYVYRYGKKQIHIDGDMSDWTPETQIDVPPNEVEGIGDSVDTNYDGVMDGVINPALDFKDLFVSHDDDYLYVRIDINEDGTFSDLENLVDGGMQAAIELFIDTDADTSTGLTWGWWYTSGDYWINLSVPYGWPGFEVPHKYGINKFIGTTGTDSRWEPLPDDSCQVAVNLDDNKMEVAIPRAALGETNGEYESTAILFLAEDPTQGWVNDAAPNDVGSQRYLYTYGQPTAIDNSGLNHTPMNFTLEQNYPNPFNPTTTIEYSIAKAQNVRLVIYNALGQKVRTLVNGVQSAGTHRFIWNGKNERGLNVPSGLYFYRLEGDHQVVTKKMILIR